MGGMTQGNGGAPAAGTRSEGSTHMAAAPCCPVPCRAPPHSRDLGHMPHVRNHLASAAALVLATAAAAVTAAVIIAIRIGGGVGVRIGGITVAVRGRVAVVAALALVAARSRARCNTRESRGGEDKT